MPALYRSYGRRKPPPPAYLNTGHPLAQGLFLAYAFNEGGPVPSGVGANGTLPARPNPNGENSNYAITWANSQTNISWSPDVNGMAVKLLASSGQGLQPSVLPQQTVVAPYSLAVLVIQTANSGYQGLIAESSARAWYLKTGVMNYYSSGTDHLASTTVSLNTQHLLGLTNDGTKIRFYLDGNLDATITLTDTTMQFDWVAGTSAATECFQGWFEAAYLWRNRLLTVSDFTWLYQEPFAFFLPPPLRFNSPVASGIPAPPPAGPVSAAGSGLFVF